MRSISLEKYISSAIFLLYIIFFFSTIQNVPFHPDEATQIYMSHDVDLLFSSPASLFYHQDASLSPEQRYRLIDAPLPRTIIGIARNIFHFEPLSADWNWSLGWAENQSNGALPPKSLLVLARIALGIFVPVGLIFFYLILKDIVSWPVSLAAAFFLGLNAIFLVHTRRAMAEGISFCFYFLTLYLVLKHPNNGLIIGLSAGLSLLSKQTVVPILLIPVSYWTFVHLFKRQFVTFAKMILVYFAMILLTYYLFNPIVWKDPFHVIILQIQYRIAFSQSQAAEYLSLASPLAANTIFSSFTSWLANTFFARPAFFDVGNYSPNLLPAITTYQSNFLNDLFTGMITGVILLVLSLFGFLGSIRSIGFSLKQENRTFMMLFFLTILQTGFALFFLPITFQRYYLFNLSLAVMWAGMGLHILLQKSLSLLK